MKENASSSSINGRPVASVESELQSLREARNLLKQKERTATTAMSRVMRGLNAADLTGSKRYHCLIEFYKAAQDLQTAASGQKSVEERFDKVQEFDSEDKTID